MSEREEQAMNKEDNKYDEFGFFNPFSVNHEEQESCIMYESKMRACKDCNHYGKLSLDCSRCDDDCSMFEDNTHYDEFGFIDPFSFRKDYEQNEQS